MTSVFAPPLRDDAGDPFGDARKQHSLRRSVCKGWRNKQWHGRLMAFIEMLWTTGYVPQLDTYIGPEAPNPLFITVLKSKKTMPEIKTVLNDIMGLTKINYNSCNFNDGLPVTVRFANMVGEVLTMGSAQGTERQPFKYYV